MTARGTELVTHTGERRIVVATIGAHEYLAARSAEPSRYDQLRGQTTAARCMAQGLTWNLSARERAKE